MIPRLSHIKDSDENFLSIEYYPSNIPAYTDAHRHNFFEVLFYTTGSSIHVIDDKEYPVDGNDIFLLSEDHVHYFKKTKQLGGYLVCFKEYFLQQNCASLENYKTALFNNLSLNIHLRPNAEERKEMLSLFQQILIENKKPNTAQQLEIVYSYLKIILIKIQQIQRNSILAERKSDYRYEQYLQFLHLLEEHFKQEHEAAWYAEEIGISLRSLSTICNQYSGESSKKLISKRLILEARRQLQFTQIQIKNIATTLCFADQFQFSKFFKNLTGSSPIDYRALFLKNN